MQKEQLGRPMWTGTWAYKESLIITGGLFVMGVLLSYVLDMKVASLSWPLNAISGSILVLTIIICRIFFNKSVFFRWISGKRNAIVTISFYLFLVILMGAITQQVNYVDDLTFRLGFSHILSSHQFFLIQIYMLLSLGMVIARHSSMSSLKDVSFITSHIGLWLTFLAIGLGAGDVSTLKMEVTKGNAEFRGVDNRGQVTEDLGIALELIDFNIDYYVPKAYIIDAYTGELANDKEFVELSQGVTTSIGDWNVTIDSTLDYAVEVDHRFVPYYNKGSVPAVLVHAEHITTGEGITGWISCGSYIHSARPLELDDNTLLIMADPEAESYESVMKIYTNTGKLFTQSLTVGHPISVDGWKIYQTSYDTEKGEWSETSIVELVKDPWIKIVYLGFILLIVGAIMMIFLGRGGEYVV